MKKKPLHLVAVLVLALLLNACKKGSNEPTPDPTKPPVETGTPIFPKKEVRAIWMASVYGLDWPQSDYSAAGQKQQYINYLEKFKALNINTIYFQVKGMGDAFYNSTYEPWSAAITGTRGVNPGYDVLKFMIDEAHARDIEFHAWMNPYRIATRSGTSSSFPALHPSVQSDWVLNFPTIQIYNPALPEVRQRLVDIVKETITKYDVDGIHFDDYFYPEGETFSDQADFVKYGAGIANIQDFRRDNVNKAIKGVYDAIVATKPGVIFSVSPAPEINKNYNTLYADVKKWNQEGWIDVVIPQLYQEIGNQYNDFQLRLAEWTNNSYKAALMVGHGFYKFGDVTMPSAFQSSGELQRQFDLTKLNNKVVGNAMYSAKYLNSNKVGITDKLASIYKDPAVMPFLGRNVAAAPTPATNVRIENGELKWNVSGNLKSVVYYFSDLKKEGKVLTIIKANTISINTNGYYAVSTLNADNQESKPSDVVEKK
ncbi:glycoside hydrolase family 10 protein [Pedobacter sp. ASV28]|uniref:glycoside hydrolase family 10 protein n=1 Tax=Pedobacter sp. ASV28 TaxID=2795123 RepID=UPI0018EB9F59|nr:family 10 glycosylhydrolase [Pedobacter sp. ASV28]